MQRLWVYGFLSLGLPVWAQAPQIEEAELPPVQVSGSVAVSATVAPAGPFEVKGVAVTVSGTTGFARDVALEQAARQALPTLLQGPQFGLNAADAAAKVKALGDAMPFVARYKIVQESVLPSYALVADLTFNEALLRKNFGGVAGAAAVSPTAGMVAPTGDDTPLATASAKQGWVVRVPEPTPAGQDRARRALAALPETTVTLRLISTQGVELNVLSSQSQEALQAALAGWQASIQPQTAAVYSPAYTPAEDNPSTLPTPRAGEPSAPAAPARRNIPAWMSDLW